MISTHNISLHYTQQYTRCDKIIYTATLFPLFPPFPSFPSFLFLFRPFTSFLVPLQILVHLIALLYLMSCHHTISFTFLFSSCFSITSHSSSITSPIYQQVVSGDGRVCSPFAMPPKHPVVRNTLPTHKNVSQPTALKHTHIPTYIQIHTHLHTSAHTHTHTTHTHINTHSYNQLSFI